MVRISSLLLLSACLAASVGAAPTRKPPAVLPRAKPAPATRIEPDLISEGKEAILVDRLKAESTTIVLFYRPADADERDLADTLAKRVKSESRVALRFVRLTALDAPIAKQYEVEATPAAFVYDRNKNLLGRVRTFTEIGELVGKGLRTARLKWVDERDPVAAETYRRFGGGRQPVPEILKTMSLRPEIMEAIGDLSRFHFSDGFLDRRTHEMIASYVSAVNRCKY
jgi:hypothetical protein